MKETERLFELMIRGQVEAMEKFLSEAQLSGVLTAGQANRFRATARMAWLDEFAKAAGGYSPLEANDKTARDREEEIMKFGQQIMPDAMKANGGAWRACIRGSNGHPPRPEKVWRAFEATRLHVEARKPVHTTLNQLAWDFYKRLPD